MITNTEQLSPWRFLFWPFYRTEVKTFVPMLIMLFLLSFNQSALWNLKDALMVTTSGAEVIPFIKVWGILPGAILFTFIFTKLSNRYSQEKVFYLMTSAFLIFYALFVFVIYPHRDQFHLNQSASYLETILPIGCKGLISMYRYWTFTVFYVACELWNTMIISVLFWSFANQITQLSQARRFYSVLSIVFNLAIVAAGVTVALLTTGGIFSSHVLIGQESWEKTMKLMMIIIVSNGLLIMAFLRWMHQKVLPDDCRAVKDNGTVKEKLSLWQSLRHVGQSRYLICIAVIVVAYSLVVNMFEVVWKDQLRNYYPKTGEYNYYISQLQIVQGALAIFISLSMALILKWFGWTKTALITPALMLVCCLFFFGNLLFKDIFQDHFMALIGMSPLAFIVLSGSIQNCITKACKYSVFDSTKEMALIPLSYESMLKGKTAIDGIGSRFGKSGSSIIHQFLLIAFASVSASAPYVSVILLVVISLWMISVFYLGKSRELRPLEVF